MNEKIPLPLTGRPQPLDSLQECVVSMECEYRAADTMEWLIRSTTLGGSDRTKATIDPKLASVARLTGDNAMNGAMVHGIRSTGASTAALGSVAAGGIDLYWYAKSRCPNMRWS